MLPVLSVQVYAFQMYRSLGVAVDALAADARRPAANEIFAFAKAWGHAAPCIKHAFQISCSTFI